MMINTRRPIKEIMKTDVVSVLPNTVMTDVAQIFDTRQFHHLPVLENNMPIGIISKHDYFLLLDSRTLMKMENYDGINDRWLGALLARDVMAKKPFCMQEEDLIADALDVFLKNKLHAILICRKDKFVGILTPYDILLELKQMITIKI